MKTILELLEGYIEEAEKLLEGANDNHEQIQNDISLLKSAYYILSALNNNNYIGL